jgi:hypothetical protein
MKVTIDHALIKAADLGAAVKPVYEWAKRASCIDVSISNPERGTFKVTSFTAGIILTRDLRKTLLDPFLDGEPGAAKKYAALLRSVADKVEARGDL